MSEGKPTYEELEERLCKIESVVQECERLSVANRYAAAVMHEVNNPLEAITNLAYIMRDEPLSFEGRKNLDLLEEQITVLTAVTRPSLAFYRDQETSKQVDLVALVDSVAKLHAGRLQGAGIEFRRHTPDTVPCDVVGSELLQVLSNLVLNAFDALTESGQGSHIHVRLRCCPHCISLLIADVLESQSMSKESCFGHTRPEKAKGSGLGLWISERIIQNHRSTIRHRTCRTAGRSGTAFRISLPCESKSSSASATAK